MHRREIIQDTVYYAIGSLGARVIGTIPFWYLYRIHGWNGAGSWSLTLTTATAVALVYSAGIRQQMTRSYAHSATPAILQQYFCYGLYCTIIGAVGTFIFSGSITITLLAVSISMWETFLHQFRCTLRANIALRYTLYNALGSACVTMLLFFFNSWSIHTYAVLYTLITGLLIFSSGYTYPMLPHNGDDIFRSIIINITGYPYALFLLLPWIMGYIDRALLARHSLELVGKYAIYDLVTQVYQLGFAAPVINSLKIRIFTLWKTDALIISPLYFYIKIMILSLLLCSVFISYFMYLLPPIILFLAPGITALLGTLVYASSWHLQFAHKNLALGIFACATCIIKTVFTIVLVPYRDIIGCFCASSLAYAIIIGVLWSRFYASSPYVPASST